jgi:hypothetical protein
MRPPCVAFARVGSNGVVIEGKGHPTVEHRGGEPVGSAEVKPAVDGRAAAVMQLAASSARKAAVAATSDQPTQVMS